MVSLITLDKGKGIRIKNITRKRSDGQNVAKKSLNEVKIVTRLVRVEIYSKFTKLERLRRG
jgi:hypothetical protein